MTQIKYNFDIREYQNIVDEDPRYYEIIGRVLTSCKDQRDIQSLQNPKFKDNSYEDIQQVINQSKLYYAKIISPRVLEIVKEQVEGKDYNHDEMIEIIDNSYKQYFTELASTLETMNFNDYTFEKEPVRFI